MKIKQISKILFVLLSILLLTSLTVNANENNTTNQTNSTPVNITTLTGDIEYQVEGTPGTKGDGSKVPVRGYADAGQLTTGFSGYSIEAGSENQTPSVVMSFSDKSSVSGFIKSYLKSFHYESGTDL
ncbi:hypothetical protein [Methanospirillum sp.]|uniref:hypothetical protein n=1 Tax=Methanospirillum sp. TaxID=45200 RepID=UPI0029860C8D|nr:hypothetical protein [Methanospirillum sp.]